MSSTSSSYTLGIDFGTLSARAVLVSVITGETVCSCEYVYPHGILSRLMDGTSLEGEWAIQLPGDYRSALFAVIRDLIAAAGIDEKQVIGLGIDTTCCTILPVDADGTPMCETEKYRSSPHAYVTLWKHHGAQEDANRIEQLERESKVPWLRKFGGHVNCEDFYPKAAQIAREAPTLFDECDRLLNLGDWLVRLLTGNDVRSYQTAAYKTWYDTERGDVPESFLSAILPGFERILDKFPKNTVMLGDCAGTLSAEAAALTGLAEGTPVSAAAIDSHAALFGCRICRPGDAVMSVGTSSVCIVQSDFYTEIDGINGVCADGTFPGLYSYEGGQAAVGDMFAWFAENCVCEEYRQEARERGVGVQTLLTEKAFGKRPGQTGLVALDWINGVRSTLMNFDLSGLICGVRLGTKPEDIYRALLEASAFGARKIISAFEESGVSINAVYASGGIPGKNPELMQLYADVLRRDISILDVPYSGAVGSALLGLAAAGDGSASLVSLAEKFKGKAKKVYHPNVENSAVYDELYRIYSQLYAMFGQQNAIMSELTRLRNS